MAKKLSPPEVIRNLTVGYWVARLIHVAAKLRLADLLKKGPRAVEDLATAAGVQPAMLYRVLRALASIGVFAETKNRRFKLTPLAATLQTDVPASMHGWALMINENGDGTPGRSSSMESRPAGCRSSRPTMFRSSSILNTTPRTSRSLANR